MQVTTDVLNSPAVAVLCGLEHAGLDLAVVDGRLRVWPVERLTAEEIVRYPSNEHFLIGTVGLQVGDEIWLGGIAGADRIVRFPAP